MSTQLFDGWEAAWSGKDPTAFAALCTSDIHYQDPLTPEPLEGPALGNVEHAIDHRVRREVGAGLEAAALALSGEQRLHAGAADVDGEHL